MASFFDLSPDEKLQLIEVLWDDLSANPDQVPVHQWQKEKLDRRKESLKKNPDLGLSWEDVEKRIRERHAG